MLDEFLPRAALKVDQSSTDVAQDLLPPLHTSLLHFLSTKAPVLKEKPISKLKNAASDSKAESRAARVAELWCAKQWAGARQLMGLGKSHKQALCAGSFSGILLLRSLCKRLNCCCLCHWMKSCRGTSEQNILSVSANAGTQPLHSGPAQRRVYGSECYKNGFVCSLQQPCSGQVHLRLKGVQLFRGRWYVWGWRWGISTALKAGA